MLLITKLKELNSVDQIAIGSALANVAFRNLIQQCIADHTTRFLSIDITKDDATVAREAREIRQEIRFYEELNLLITEYLRNKPKGRG